MKIGELAKRTGLTVRTLHHYDEIGLVRPSLRTNSEHRLYTDQDVVRLQRVLSLRQLGFSLQQIGECLDKPDFDPVAVLREQIAKLQQQIAAEQNLCVKLKTLLNHSATSEQFLQVIEMMTMIENYYTPEQSEILRMRREMLGDSGMQKAHLDWEQLLNDYRLEMEQGTDPTDPRLKSLEQRRQDLIAQFTGGNVGIEQSLKRLWAEQSDKLSSQHGYEPNLMEFVQQVAKSS